MAPAQWQWPPGWHYIFRRSGIPTKTFNLPWASILGGATPKWYILPNRWLYHQTIQISKIEALTYISCMDTAYGREFPPPLKQPKGTGKPSISGTWILQWLYIPHLPFVPYIFETRGLDRYLIGLPGSHGFQIGNWKMTYHLLYQKQKTSPSGWLWIAVAGYGWKNLIIPMLKRPDKSVEKGCDWTDVEQVANNIYI